MPTRGYHTFSATSWQAVLIQRATGRQTTHADRPCSCIATPITKHLYLSDFLTARTPRNLQHLDITHVLSAIQADLSKHFDGGILVIHVPIKDTPNANLLMWFNRVVEFIARVLDSNRNHKVPVCPALMNTDIFARYTACKAYHVLRSSCARIRWLKLAWAHLEAIEYVSKTVYCFLNSRALTPARGMGAPFGAGEKMEGEVDTLWSRRRVGY